MGLVSMQYAYVQKTQSDVTDAKNATDMCHTPDLYPTKITKQNAKTIGLLAFQKIRRMIKLRSHKLK